MPSPIVLGNSPLHQAQNPVTGTYLALEGQQFYKIAHYDTMRPFFMSLVSPTDHWMFISSTGGLTAGRKNQGHSLFPYYTDDKLADSAEKTGSKTIILAEKEGAVHLWEPFSKPYGPLYQISRNLYKNQVGNILIFEEVNHSLGLSFRYSWQFSEQFGFVKRASLQCIGEATVKVRVLDGLQNILPYGISHMMQNERSNLSHAYKKCELEAGTGLGMYMLSAMIVDKAEPSEALRATTVWSAGLDASHHLLSSLQLDAFRTGQALQTEVDMKAEPGSYFIASELDLTAGSPAEWYIVAEIEQDHAAVISLIDRLQADQAGLLAALKADIKAGTEALRKLVGMADGLQLTGYPLSAGRHYANVLFNIMRGGLFEDGYAVEKDDLLDYVQTIRPAALVGHAAFFDGLSDTFAYQDLLSQAEANGDHDLIRICYEYLPISFSRRHGDPSRPWNRFSIEIHKPDGSKSRYYQGNWRDIFQNWEALAYSFPGFINAMITKFVNASTIDGYNPYRITRDGIDWEIIEPDDEWSFIGYWGDHQIIYLLKLLEVASAHDRDAFEALLRAQNYVYANVPYRIKSHAEIVRDPQDTIDFDDELHAKIEARCETMGADGKLVYDAEMNPVRATLAEKLLLTLLTKLYNFVPEAGIWLNTQRPEWNDANNALVGNGVSMVTLYYIRRYIKFCQDLFGRVGDAPLKLNAPVAELLHGIAGVLAAHQAKIDRTFTDAERKEVVNALGRLGESYRNLAYQGFNGQETQLSQADLLDFLALAQRYVDHTIKLNKREDGLYHAYNLITIQDETVEISYLYEMLEGQVAVLSAGLLDSAEALSVLNALNDSDMYRPDQYSYMLYPNRELPRFLDKNLIPADFATNSKLAQVLLEAGNNSLLTRDGRGAYHFSGDFHNADDVKAALDALSSNGYADLVAAEYDAWLAIFEQMFDHKAFTGRSGTFFGYEGLGSIYWHMVSKLLLAAQETLYAGSSTDDEAMRGQLVEHYYSIRAGIGINKSPELYGAFPTDPYSHTPFHKGAQQPGMTGQVKEDVLNRWAELGVRVAEGQLSFVPSFLHPEEYLTEAVDFHYYDLEGQAQTRPLAAGQLAFTYCQVPVVYQQSEQNCIHIETADGTRTIMGQTLDRETSRVMFSRAGVVKGIVVEVAA